MRSHWKTFSLAVVITALAAPPVASAGPFSQMGYSSNAAERDRDASNLSRRAGQNSIGRGHHNSHRGHHMGAAGAPLMALGAMQVARGMLGLMASVKAAKLSKQNAANSLGFSDIQGSSPAANSDLTRNASGRSASGVALDSATLHSGELGEATGLLQEYYGLSAEDLAGALASGTDPRTIFMNAPTNPISAAEANEAMRGALQSEREALADEAKAIVAGNVSAPAPAPDKAKSEDRAPASLPAAKDTSLRDSLRAKLQGAEQEELSPELQAALREQELARRRQNEEPATLFDIVHKKYRERNLSMLPPSTI